jgi:hypothetical protein
VSKKNSKTKVTKRISSSKQELLLKEYEIISTQVIHWDKFFWDKSQFFLAIESLMLVGISQVVIGEISNKSPIALRIYSFLLIAIVFNIFLCYVWFRANRSNREYLQVRYNRAKEIEMELGGNAIKIFQYQDRFLREPKQVKHSSKIWEIQIPMVFTLGWFILLGYIGDETDVRFLFLLTLGIIALCVITILFIEKTGRPISTRI